MLTNKEKADKLRLAITLLQDVDCLQQEVLGDCDVCYDTHNRIEDLIEDLRADLMDFEEPA